MIKITYGYCLSSLHFFLLFLYNNVNYINTRPGLNVKGKIIGWLLWFLRTKSLPIQCLWWWMTIMFRIENGSLISVILYCWRIVFAKYYINIMFGFKTDTKKNNKIFMQKLHPAICFQENLIFYYNYILRFNLLPLVN